jgi:hypothetical protein
VNATNQNTEELNEEQVIKFLEEIEDMFLDAEEVVDLDERYKAYRKALSVLHDYKITIPNFLRTEAMNIGFDQVFKIQRHVKGLCSISKPKPAEIVFPKGTPITDKFLLADIALWEKLIRRMGYNNGRQKKVQNLIYKMAGKKFIGGKWVQVADYYHEAYTRLWQAYWNGVAVNNTEKVQELLQLEDPTVEDNIHMQALERVATREREKFIDSVKEHGDLMQKTA